MIIQWKNGSNFHIKTKSLATKIGDENYLGDLKIDGPGEYEVSGIQMEIIDGIIQVFAEGMTIGHIKKAKVLSDDELQKLNGINILLIGVGGEGFSETKIAQEVINQIEPNIVIPMYKNNLDDFSTKDGKSNEPSDELKITKAELPQEGHEVVILNAH